jgi:outer membrane protein assembly factor BamB
VCGLAQATANGRSRIGRSGAARIATARPRSRVRDVAGTAHQKWKVEVGIGYAAPITVGDRVYAFSRQSEDEVMRALDAATGKTIWETKYNATYKPNPAATRKHGTGPKSTPTFADGRSTTLGMTGVVTAFDAATGKQLWQTAPPKTERCITPACRRSSIAAS